MDSLLYVSGVTLDNHPWNHFNNTVATNSMYTVCFDTDTIFVIINLLCVLETFDVYDKSVNSTALWSMNSTATINLE